MEMEMGDCCALSRTGGSVEARVTRPPDMPFLSDVCLQCKQSMVVKLYLFGEEERQESIGRVWSGH